MQSISSKKAKVAKSLRQIRLTLIALTLLFAVLAAAIHKNYRKDELQLETVVGNISSYRRANVVEGKKSTLVRLENLDDKEFNLGETIDHKSFVAAFNSELEKNEVELVVPSRILKMTRPIIPAFYSVKVNGHSIRSMSESKERNDKTKFYVLIPILVLGLAIIVLRYYEGKMDAA